MAQTKKKKSKSKSKPKKKIQKRQPSIGVKLAESRYIHGPDHPSLEKLAKELKGTKGCSKDNLAKRCKLDGWTSRREQHWEKVRQGDEAESLTVNRKSYREVKEYHLNVYQSLMNRFGQDIDREEKLVDAAQNKAKNKEPILPMGIAVPGILRTMKQIEELYREDGIDPVQDAIPIIIDEKSHEVLEKIASHKPGPPRERSEGPQRSTK